MSVTPNRIIPPKSTGSKTVFTPCRRVGLSRKVRTPISTTQKVTVECSPYKDPMKLTPISNINEHDNNTPDKKQKPKIATSSKTVLTPCRRLGLSRKIKPQQIANQVLESPSQKPPPVEVPVSTKISEKVTESRSEIKTEKPSDKNDQVCAKRLLTSSNDTDDDIPLLKRMRKVATVISDDNSDEFIQEHKENKKITKTGSAEFITEDYLESTEDICDDFVPTNISKRNSITKKQKVTKAVKLLKKVPKGGKKNNLGTELSKFDTQDFLEATSPENIGVSNNSDHLKLILTPLLDSRNQIFPAKDTFESNKSNTIPKGKLCKNALSLKKTVESESSEEVVRPVKLNKMCKEVSIKLRRLTTDEIEQSNEPIVEDSFSDKITNKVNKIILSSDDEDAFTSTPEADKYNKPDLIQRIEDLESEIKSNNEKLSKLKQASIYKQKHDPIELDKIIKLWKEGCVSAVSDLLKVLRSHGMSDINSVLVKLSIPTEIRTKLPKELFEV